MEQFVGMSKTGSIKEAAEGLKNPQFLMLFDSSKERFKESVSQLEEMFPGVPSIGCVGQFYGKTQVLENGVMVVGFSGGIRAAADVFTDVSTMPVKCIRKFQQNVTNINASADNTVLIDFCSGNDECVLATMESVLKSKKIQLTGGTAWEGLVCCNGQVYEDACAYALVKNESGRVKVYKENIYLRKDAVKHIVTRSEPRTYTIQEIDGRRAEDVYTKELGISQSMLTNYENGNGTPRDESIWEKLSQIFGVSKSHVMGLTTDIETTQKTNRLKVVVDMSQPVSVHPKNQTELDILVKMDLLDDDDTEKLLCFINELLAKDKYEGRRESAIEYLAE